MRNPDAEATGTGWMAVESWSEDQAVSWLERGELVAANETSKRPNTKN